MEQKEIIQKTATYIRQQSEGESSGHDWWHIYRVWQMAKYIANQERIDSFIPELAALLHDIADWKFHDGDDSVGPKKAREWLTSIKVDEPIIIQVETIIKNMSFKGAKVETPMETIEGKIVQDADRLDAIGASGIGRTFAYGGNKGLTMHDPERQPMMHTSFEEYKNTPATTINHFHEKLLLLKDRMNTETAKRIAIGRHEFMKKFLDQFDKEWKQKA